MLPIMPAFLRWRRDRLIRKIKAFQASVRRIQDRIERNNYPAASGMPERLPPGPSERRVRYRTDYFDRDRISALRIKQCADAWDTKTYRVGSR